MLWLPDDGKVRSFVFQPHKSEGDLACRRRTTLDPNPAATHALTTFGPRAPALAQTLRVSTTRGAFAWIMA